MADLQVARPHAWKARTPGAKVVVVVAVTVSLVGVLVFAAAHEASQQTSAPLANSRTAQAPVPTKQPLTRDEEAFAQALWPIHNEVKLVTSRLISTSIQLKLGAAPTSRLEPEAKEAAEVYERAESQVRNLKPPPSMEESHGQYLEAIRLYRESCAELAGLFSDGQTGHMEAAQPPREQASQILRRVGARLWPNEYMPN